MRSDRWSFLGVGMLAVALASTATAAELAGADFVGPESCKACHPDAYAAWRQSKHARAIEPLSEAQRRDVRCLSCHAPNLQERRVESVSCETCHGAGQYYATQYVMKDSELVRLVGLVDPSEKGCRSCHDASSPSLKPFEFVEKLKLIDHWTVERQRRDQPRSAGASGTQGPASMAPPAPIGGLGGTIPPTGAASAPDGGQPASAGTGAVTQAGSSTATTKPAPKPKPKPKPKKTKRKKR